jgi:Tol biopolymer transport system component
VPVIVGKRLGTYEVTALIGAGGMGEVYTARDTTLNRDVALKILPAAFALDADRVARFKREAQVLASLNHPNIGAIYGFEHGDAVHALVLELVDGPTLADRIAKGPLPLDEALAIARQIAQALEAAHEQGIVHRDLKPANVKVRPDGTVKVLDFGLAKAIEPPGAAHGTLSMSPTITSPAMTQAGIILGTAAYMSPEQARGKPIDKRADIWAFGCLLFEMLTGHRAFDAEDVSLTLAEVMKSEPDWARVPALPSAVRMCLRRCLKKDPQQRLRDIGEARLALEGAIEVETSVEPSVGAQPAPRRIWPWVLPFAAGSALAAAAVSVWLQRALAPLPGVVRFEIHAPAGSTIPPGVPAISPDGRTLAYGVTAADGITRLHLRDLDSTESRPLAGTEGAVHPFWSPDGRFLAFTSGFVLKRFDIADGSLRELTRVIGPWHGSLNQFGDLLFAGEGVSRMQAEGGAATPALRLDPNAGERNSGFPAFLPDGKRFVVRIGRDATGALHVASLDSPGRKLVLDNVLSGALVAPTPRGATYLLYVTDEALVAREFDEKAGEVRGAPRPIVNGIGSVASPAIMPAAGVSPAGVLAYQTGGDFVSGVLYWVGRSGERLASIELAGSNPRLSPDGRWVAAGARTRGEVNVWVTDLGRGIASKLTRGGGPIAGAVWSADGRRLAFGWSRKIYVKNADGSGDETVLADVSGLPTSWSSDGKNLLFTIPSGKLFLLPVSGGGTPIPVGSRSGRSRDGQLSRDGRYLAYVADETGTDEIYVQPLPPASGRIQVSGGGGTTPRWSHSGRELFFVSRGAMMAVDVRLEPTLSADVPKKLFQLGSTSGPFGYDVGLDDQRFLVERRRADVQDTPITVVLNWWVPLAQQKR